MNMIIFVALFLNYKVAKFINETSFLVKYAFIIGFAILLKKTHLDL